ncbi:MAG: hypothetical protein LQ342_006349 [Letrouitia transgressa]|nr:MAG: hypothetical protein LQ342_006349 [Letrouitia transgressa]
MNSAKSFFTDTLAAPLVCFKETDHGCKNFNKTLPRHCTFDKYSGELACGGVTEQICNYGTTCHWDICKAAHTCHWLERRQKKYPGWLRNPGKMIISLEGFDRNFASFSSGLEDLFGILKKRNGTQPSPPILPRLLCSLDKCSDPLCYDTPLCVRHVPGANEPPVEEHASPLRSGSTEQVVPPTQPAVDTPWPDRPDAWKLPHTDTPWPNRPDPWKLPHTVGTPVEEHASPLSSDSTEQVPPTQPAVDTPWPDRPDSWKLPHTVCSRFTCGLPACQNSAPCLLGGGDDAGQSPAHEESNAFSAVQKRASERVPKYTTLDENITPEVVADDSILPFKQSSN